MFEVTAENGKHSGSGRAEERVLVALGRVSSGRIRGKMEGRK